MERNGGHRGVATKPRRVASRRLDSPHPRKCRPSTSATCGTDVRQSARERSYLAEDPLGACWLPSEPSWSGWQRLAGTLSWAGGLTRGGSDRGFKRRLRTPTVDEQRLAVLDPQWGAPPHLPGRNQGRVLTLGSEYESSSRSSPRR
jgi:hypothetical protein